MGMEGVVRAGFATTTTDKLINWSRTGSLWLVFGVSRLAALQT